ncbi:MAG: lipopolysaccharide biosynthesis protein [Planctomycetota bacterium]|nr:lipopolysaccharide biosynthesis protein [Planctomycetota bacterium]
MSAPAPAEPKRSLRLHFLITAGGMVFTQLASFLALTLVARGLGPAEQGRFQLVVALAVGVVSLAKLGLDEAAAYLLPKWKVEAPAERPAAILRLLGAPLLAAAVLAGLVALAAEPLAARVFAQPELAPSLRATPALALGLVFLLMSMAVLRGLGRTDLRAYVGYYGVGALFLAGVAWLWREGMALGAVLDLRAATWILCGIAGAACLLPALRGPREPLQPARRRELYTFGAMAAGLSFLTYVLDQPIVDLAVLGHFESPHVVGVYAASYRVGALVSVALTAMTVVAPARFAEALARGDIETVRAQYEFASAWLFRLGVCAFLGLFYFGPFILELFGPEYPEGFPYLLCFAGGSAFAVCCGLNTPLLLAAGRLRVELILGATGAAALLGLGILLSRSFGALGMAAASGGVIALLGLARALYVRRALLPPPAQPRADGVRFAAVALPLVLAFASAGLADLLPEGRWAPCYRFALVAAAFWSGVAAAEAMRRARAARGPAP